MDPQPSNNNNGTTNNEAEDPLVMELPPGYKFIPDDVDLIAYYLKYKLAGFHVNPPRIKDVEVYKYSPQELEKYHKFKGEKEMYFFTRRSKKYEEGSRPNRDVKNHDGIHIGFWKATGKENPVMNNDIEVGFKRTLVYYEGKQDKPKQNKGKQEKSDEKVKSNWKTNWIMQEFRIKDLTSSSATPPNMDDWVLCKIYEHQYGMKKSQMEGQNNKQVTITVAPQCQLNQYHQTQCMQSSLSPNMVDNSQFQFNQHYGVQQALDDSSKYAMVSRQPNQCSKSQPSNLIGITQHQSNQCDDAQQMQASSSPNMIVAPQYHSNQHSQVQPMKICLSANTVYQYDDAQQMQASSSSNKIVAPQNHSNQPIRSCLSADMVYQYDDAQQMQASSSPNMIVAPQYHSNQHSQVQPMKSCLSANTVYQYDDAQQMQASSSSNKIVAPQNHSNQPIRSCLSADMVYQYADAQRMQASSSSDKIAAPQNHSNQHSQVQPIQSCLTANVVYNSKYISNQHSQDQQMQDSQMEDYYNDLCQLINLDDKDLFVE